MALSQRLSFLRSCFTDSETIIDVGCDHGDLGLSFVGHPKVRDIILVDPSEKVISKLKHKLLDSHIPKGLKIQILHQKGQDLKLSSTSKTIFIAGMGGKEIRDILQTLEGQLLASDRVVISPHRNILILRDFLRGSSLLLVQESVLYEDGQYYQVLVLSKSGRKPVHLYGEEVWQGDIGKMYREHLLLHFGPHQDQLSLNFLAYLKALN